MPKKIRPQLKKKVRTGVRVGADARLFAELRRSRLAGRHKPSADPDGTRAHHQRGREATAVKDAAGGDELHRLARQGGAVLAADVGAGGDQDAGGYLARVATRLAALGADKVGAYLAGLMHMLAWVLVGAETGTGVKMAGLPLDVLPCSRGTVDTISVRSPGYVDM